MGTIEIRNRLSRVTWNSVLLVLIGALVLAQGCKHARASAEAGQPASAQTNMNDSAPGCHSVVETVTATSPVEPASRAADPPPGMRSNNMLFIKGGTFIMGTAAGLPVEGPEHEVSVKSFWMDEHEVTVSQFAEFVDAARYLTDAERFGWSGVFDVQAGAWKRVKGAAWRHPDGPATTARADEPVTQVSWSDAAAYAAWAKKRLPTEAEFEYAVRGGLSGKRYAWGDALTPDGRYMANFWQGSFPTRDLGNDGFNGRATVGSFAPNGYGLYDITGNVWEWCADWFEDGYYKVSSRVDPAGPSTGGTRVIRGGSWLCSDNYCTGYRVAARNHTAADSGLNNLGFRCVRD
jgi:formylglycine-generating enzyme required for sulfatase activity